MLCLDICFFLIPALVEIIDGNTLAVRTWKKTPFFTLIL